MHIARGLYAFLYLFIFVVLYRVLEQHARGWNGLMRLQLIGLIGCLPIPLVLAAPFIARQPHPYVLASWTALTALVCVLGFVTTRGSYLLGVGLAATSFLGFYLTLGTLGLA